VGFGDAEVKAMSIEAPTSDAGLLDLLRVVGPMGVSELADAMEVTPTAVRQRLIRLLAQNSIQREANRHGRGRPRHRYWLTEKGIRLTGSNFTDLAVTLWNDIRQSGGDELRRETLRRIARALAAAYSKQIEGETPAERMNSLAKLMAQRRIPVSVESSEQGTVLTEHACPYPKLAEQDPDVCNMERMMFSELLGGEVELTECRLQGGAECRFQAK
jgi:DeoR family transcriptional regulator, suf operon transcriptional repressor